MEMGKLTPWVGLPFTRSGTFWRNVIVESSEEKWKKRIFEDMHLWSVYLQYEKEDEESASILAKWDLCLNPIKKKVLTTGKGMD